MKTYWEATVVGDRATVDIKKQVDLDGSEIISVSDGARSFEINDINYAFAVANHVAQHGSKDVVA